jgi:hypothetical protein
LRPKGLFFPLLTTLASSIMQQVRTQDWVCTHSAWICACSSERIEASIELNQHQLWWSLNPNTISNKKPWMENMIFKKNSGFLLPMITDGQMDRQVA